MFKAKHSKSFVIALLLICTIFITACDQLDGLFGGKDEVDLPSMAPDLDEMQLERDESGLNEVDRQYLAYAKDKSTALAKAMENFENTMDSYLEEIFEKVTYVTENKDYIQSKTKLLEVVRKIEEVAPDAIPENFVELYNKLYQSANRVRYMLYLVEQQNATNLPEAFNEIAEEIKPFQEAADNFFATVEAEGLEAAVAAIPAIDWEAEESRASKQRGSFNVADYGLFWGSSRWDVMGVEGLKKDGFKSEYLSYDTKVYQYTAVRNYHFNEYGQLDSYDYDIDAASFDIGENPQDPVYDDVKGLSPIVMYDFIADTFAIPQEPVVDEAGNLSVYFDPPAEKVVLQGNAESLKVYVEAKTAAEADVAVEGEAQGQ